MLLRDLDYELPGELIAQRPLERRDESRLLVYERASGQIRHCRFRDLPTELHGELVVVNDTRVVPARLNLRKPTGGQVEVLLLEPLGGGVWEALARPSRKLAAGQRLGPVELIESLGEGRWRIALEGEPAGEAPLPPYIHEKLEDPERYQTVFAERLGSAAAPTAGLHFTPELLESLDVVRITLHVGLDTFRPVAVDDLAEHRLHGERYEVSPENLRRIELAERVLAVGTTSVRVLETLARGAPLAGRTDLFVYPPFEFKRVDALLTNFHLPRSTLLALVMAFAGVKETRELYRLAIAERYRFYSFGDAMLVL
ncbi:MAG: tRNA preQ1(34) S-adenosylmethionine ribosyltransferase-isomerase QueA [Gaiellaceae bacterium]|jgi:S-adenosylmethionine:tRNA ribosyltransferase-isomerase